MAEALNRQNSRVDFGRNRKLLPANALPPDDPCRAGGFREMADDVPLKLAVDTAWSVYRITHQGIDAADSRRCLLERHLRGRWQAREEDVEELASFGIAYLARLPEDEC